MSSRAPFPTGRGQAGVRHLRNILFDESGKDLTRSSVVQVNSMDGGEQKKWKIVLVEIAGVVAEIVCVCVSEGKVEIGCEKVGQGLGKVLCNISFICDYATRRNLQSVKVLVRDQDQLRC